MNPEKKKKLKSNAYYISLAVVLVFVAIGFYMKRNDPQPTATEKVELSTDATLTIQEGDQVRVDFVGYLDGEEMKHGSTKGKGMDVTVGSGKLMDQIEEQLIGHHPGENYTMTVTFAEDYKEKDLRGKEATIDMTIHGVYVVVEESENN